jgi:hypothetical protein
MSATKIGSVPNMRATVAAVVSRTEYANVTWFSQIPSAAAVNMNQTCSRRTRRLPSRPNVKAEKSTAPTAKRTDEYVSGFHPCVSAYFTTVKLKLQNSTVMRRRTSGGRRCRMAPKAMASRSRSAVLESRPMAREPTIEDVDALVGPATPHFAYQLRARVRALVRDLPEDHPVRKYGEEKMELLDRLGHATSKAEEGPIEPESRPGWETIPSHAPLAKPPPPLGE